MVKKGSEFMHSKAVMEVMNLTKKVGRTNIIDDVSFHLNEGEIKGLLGPNGSGKTSLLRLLVGLWKPTSGEIMIDQYNIQTDFENAISKVGSLIENPEFYDYLSGYDNLMQVHRLQSDSGRSRVEEVIEILEMESYIYDRVASYSLGMRQRLGLAIAYLSNPKILLLDEPTNGLDPEGIQNLRDYLNKLKDEGVSILISSHLLAEIEMICDRIIILDNGRIVSEGALEEYRGHSSEQGRYFFKVMEMERFEPLLKEQERSGFIDETLDHGFFMTGTEREVASMNRFLVDQGMSVVGIEKSQATLEDAFLSHLRREQ